MTRLICCLIIIKAFWSASSDTTVTYSYKKSKEGDKDQESIKSNTTPHTRDHIERISREMNNDR